MSRYTVVDLGEHSIRRWRVWDSKDRAIILQTKDRRVAEGLSADYNSRLAPPLLTRVLRFFGLRRPKPAAVEHPWQAKIARMDALVESRKNGRVA
jgi:hypothetical protein